MVDNKNLERSGSKASKHVLKRLEHAHGTATKVAKKASHAIELAIIGMETCHKNHDH